MSNPADEPFAPSAPQAATGAEAASLADAPPDHVAVMADGTLKFIDRFVDSGKAGGISRRYFEDEADIGTSDSGALYVVSLDDGVFHHPVTHEAADGALTYVVTAEAALDAFAGSWMPVPVLRVLETPASGEQVLDQGPTNWARVYVARGENDGRPGWHVVTAVDTTLATGTPPRDGSLPSPTPADAEAGRLFVLAADENDIGGFVAQAWVDDWLREVYAEGVRGKRGRDEDGWDEQRPLAHVANYLTLLSVLTEAAVVPRITLERPSQGDTAETVGVDLVLDIGAARTCVLMRDGGPDADTVMAPITPLVMRDMTRPWLTYHGILPSRLTFARAQFGKEALSRWSGRANAYSWPSLARIGVEAEWLAATQSNGTDLSSVSSPIRYLWDERRSPEVWRFARGATGAGGRGSIVSGPLLAHVGELGEIATGEARGPGTTKPRFSRSSLTTFFIAEVLAQALAGLNPPQPVAADEGGDRRRRRIARVLLTAAGNLHADGRRLLEKRAQEAIALVWQGLGWLSVDRHPRRPDVAFTGDNATNAQTVFLYNEIEHKFRGQARDYFDLMGKVRPGQRAGRTLRIGAFDIGAGTTAVSVATYELGHDDTLTSVAELIDGLPGGGDDALKAIIERHIVPAIVERLGEAGIDKPQRFFASLLAESDDKKLGARAGGFGHRFAAHLARPAAIALLKEYAAQPSVADDVPVVRTLGMLARQGGSDATAIADLLDEIAGEEGADSFSPLQTPITFLSREVGETVGSVLQPVLTSAIRLVQALDCDIVLLSGWLARLPVVMDTIIEGLPTRPNRIVALNDYRVAEWYPGRLPSERIAAPKTTAAVGGLLQAIGALRVARRGTTEEAQKLVLGRLSSDRTIEADDVLFTLPPPGMRETTSAAERTATLAAELPLMLGVRRLAIESWPATPLYQIELKDSGRRERAKGPLKLTLERVPGGNGDYDGIAVMRACDADGTTILPAEIEVRSQMLTCPEGHWLDTGTIALLPQGDKA